MFKENENNRKKGASGEHKIQGIVWHGY